MNREFLMLAHVADLAKDSIGGWFMSEKLDGMRAFWDGGITRGLPCNDIPFANVEKHARFVNQQYSTGLWTRYGQPIQAPGWWLDLMPKMVLDGELTMGRGTFQEVVSCVKQHMPDRRWADIKYAVFDTPNLKTVVMNGRINNTNFKKEFLNVWDKLMTYVSVVREIDTNSTFGFVNIPFEFAYKHLIISAATWPEGTPARVHNQQQLPLMQTKAVGIVEEYAGTVCQHGGEGAMLRKRESIWQPYRTNDLLKVKPMKDSEAKVVGYVTGRRTELGSKLLGMLGALVVEWRGKTFELSGFTDEERELTTATGRVVAAKEWAEANPASHLPAGYWATHFPLGTMVTFKYRELTNDGIPKEARYFRKAT